MTFSSTVASSQNESLRSVRKTVPTEYPHTGHDREPGDKSLPEEELNYETTITEL